MAFENIRVSRGDGIVTLTLHRPERRNAMNAAMGVEVEQAVEEIRADGDARVVVITGTGKAFSSGGDLRMLSHSADPSAGDDPGMGGAPRDFYTRFMAIRRLAVPTIAALNGHAIGAGLCLALACDMRLAVADAKMGMTFTRLGIHPGMGATYFLPRLVGTARACELLFTGRVIDALEAERLGVVNRAVARDEFPAAVRALAQEIATAGPLAVRMTKAAVYRGLEHSLDDMLDFESLQQELTFGSADAREGIEAVLEKRPPKFKGH